MSRIKLNMFHEYMPALAFYDISVLSSRGLAKDNVDFGGSDVSP